MQAFQRLKAQGGLGVPWAFAFWACWATVHLLLLRWTRPAWLGVVAGKGQVVADEGQVVRQPTSKGRRNPDLLCDLREGPLEVVRARSPRWGHTTFSNPPPATQIWVMARWRDVWRPNVALPRPRFGSPEVAWPCQVQPRFGSQEGRGHLVAPSLGVAQP